jgi:hypothetical protein
MEAQANGGWIGQPNLFATVDPARLRQDRRRWCPAVPHHPLAWCAIVTRIGAVALVTWPSSRSSSASAAANRRQPAMAASEMAPQ